MNIPPKYMKLMPVLLFAAAIVFMVGDRIQFGSGLPTGEAPAHDHGTEEIDHSDPEAQRRMGIFHYNEGNKFSNQGNWEEAIRNYKMALHHNKNFEEAYINLSTAYLSGKQFDEGRDTLTDLEKINPSHPLLHYNLACYHALTGQTGPALEALQRAVGFGYKDFRALETDPDLENLRNDPKFQQWRNELPT
ncbi:MAG: tetratricopeptide repeat protein [Nitrospinae bacterium]|nr:tetratricopeptide repeat protein [Nitrospinota bacterium]